MAEDDVIGIGSHDEWTISCSREQFEFLVEQEFFPLLVGMSRAVNAIRFCLSAGVTNSSSDSPASRRERANAFFHLASHLYEIFGFVDLLQVTFADLQSFQEELLPLVRDADTVALRKNELKVIRNRLTFHASDTTALRAGLRRMSHFPSERHAFSIARGWQATDVYYLIGDVAASVFVVGGEPGSYRPRYEDLIERVIGLAAKIVNALDAVIAEVFKHPERLTPPLPRSDAKES